MSLGAALAVSVAGRSAARRFEQATRDPAAAQQRKLLAILQQNRDTEYGREHSFATIGNLREYAAAVPVVSYHDIEERIDRITRGEKNILTAEDPVMFARTSGTTGKPKFIPVTPTCQGRDHADQTAAWVYHAQAAHPDLLRGKVLSLVSPAVEGRTEADIPYGSTSGHIYKNFPWLIRTSYVLPYDVFEIEDYDAKYYVVVRMGLAADVTFLVTANPSSILKLAETADQRADLLLRDLADGTLSRDLDIPGPIRALIEARLRPDRARARALEDARRRREGRFLPVDYWPNLALISCWKGGTVHSYVERFPEWFGADGRTVPVRELGYLSSEARGSIPLSDEGCGGVLTVATNVYEFVAAEELEDHPDRAERWTFLGAADIEDGKEYYIFVTTTGGLYRYDINDVIQVEGRHNQTPVIAFLRKGRGFTNITGEKVSVNQVIQAIEESAKELDLTIDHFKALADGKTGRYVFQVESAAEIPEAQRQPLLQRLDEKLASLNIEYQSKRKSKRLKPPALQVMKPGWYEEKKKAEVADGKRAFQAKTVLLAPKPEGDDHDRAMVLAELDGDAER